MTTQPVVVGVNGSLIAVRALDWAAEEAVRRGAGLHRVRGCFSRGEVPRMKCGAMGLAGTSTTRTLWVRCGSRR